LLIVSERRFLRGRTLNSSAWGRRMKWARRDGGEAERFKGKKENVSERKRSVLP